MRSATRLRVHISALRKKLRAALGYDPIRNRIGEGYEVGGERAMKRLSLQWRITLMTALLIAGACICLNLLLYRSGASGMDNLNGYVLQYQQDGGEDLTIEIPEDQMSDFLVQFSQEVYDTKTILAAKGGALRQW